MAGLAALVKRKLGKDAGSTPKKKIKLPPGTTPAQLAALASKNTRTARRKLRRLGLEGVTLEDLPPADRIDALSDGDEAEGGDGGDAEEPAAGRAYDALLSSLAGANEALAGAVELRRRELAGDSDQSESEREEDEEEEEEDGSGSDSEEEEEDSGSEGEEDVEAASDGEVGAEEEVLEEEDEEEEEEEEAANGAAAAPAGPPAVDYFEAHLEAQLSEDALAALADGPTGYVDLEEAAGGGGGGGAKQRRALAALQAWLPGARVQAAPGTALPPSVPSLLRDYGVRERLITRWREVHAGEGGAAGAAAGDFVSAQQRALFALLSTYADVHHPCRPYPAAAGAPDPELDAVLLHCLNHVARCADRIKKNNEKLGAGAAGADADVVPRDQGFTRPKVLILAPMRGTALSVVTRLLALALRETRTDSIQGKARFLEEFGDGEEGGEGAEEGLSARARAALARKPAEHRALFAGNLDDHFRLGIKLTRGAARLYADFFQSDVLVASPLALATKLSEGAKEGAGAADFLSSIEIVVLERADVLGMQNWAHVAAVMGALNGMPAAQRDADIMRVREWYLAGQARHYRQTILLSSFASAEANALAGRGCANCAGRVRVTPAPRGVLGAVVPQVRQTFQRLAVPAAAGPAGDPDARFERFKAAEWPRIRESARGGGQLIYVPSYFDYVRVRNFLRAESASFVGLCEYTDRSDMARARAYFADGRRRVLLYTERAQFYNRHRIRGIADVFFYQLPEHPQFYAELLNFMDEEGGGGGGAAAGLPTATVVYTKYDALRLERVVGGERAKAMLKKKNGTFLFC